MNAARSAPSSASLPDLERDVLALVAEGHGDQDIAARLGLGNARKVYYRVQRIGVHLGLKAPTRPHLVDRAYVLGAVPAPAPLQPLVLKAEQDHVVRMVAAGGTIERYAREKRLTQHQVAYAVRKAQQALDAATFPALVRRAWQRQLLGPTLFAADLARMRAQQPAEPDLGRHVIVPLASGHRLALPARGLHPVRHLDVPSEAEALAAARYLSARDGFTPLQVVPSEHPDGPFRVSWGRLEVLPRPRRDLALVRPRQPPVRRGRTA